MAAALAIAGVKAMIPRGIAQRHLPAAVALLCDSDAFDEWPDATPESGEPGEVLSVIATSARGFLARWDGRTVLGAGVAIGGRTTLLGPVLGAIGIGWAQSSLSEEFPSGWIYFQGALFIIVVGFFPAGIAGLAKLRIRRRAKKIDEPEPVVVAEPVKEPVG